MIVKPLIYVLPEEWYKMKFQLIDEGFVDEGTPIEGTYLTYGFRKNDNLIEVTIETNCVGKLSSYVEFNKSILKGKKMFLLSDIEFLKSIM